MQSFTSGEVQPVSVEHPSRGPVLGALEFLLFVGFASDSGLGVYVRSGRMSVL